MRATLLLLAVLALPAAAGDNPWDGTWQASYEGTAGADREGSIVVSGDGGTWKMLRTSKKNPCFGREYPIVVQKATAEELTFEVSRSKTLTGCQDTVMTFKPAGDKTLEGTFENGRKLTLKRE